MAEEACEQVIDVLAGRSARYAVNAPLLTPETARAIAPYLPLTETLGRIAAQYSAAAVKTLTVDVAGELAAHDAAQLTAAALRGILENATTERVNLINAAFLARNRGLTVTERKTTDAGTFASLVTLTVEGDNRHGRRGRHGRQRRADGSSGSTTTGLTWRRRSSWLLTRHGPARHHGPHRPDHWAKPTSTSAPCTLARPPPARTR